MRKKTTDRLSSLLLRKGRGKWPALIALYAVFLLPVVLLAAYSYLRSYENLTRFTLSRRQAIAYLAATTLENQFDRLTDLSTSLATRVRFRQLVAEKRWDEAIQILKAIPSDFPFIDRAFLTDTRGTLEADVPALPGVRGKNFSFRDWYRGVSAAWQPYISEVYKRAAAPRNNVVAVAVPITTEDGRVVGILVVQIQLETFLKWSRGIQVGDSGFVYLVDSKGRVAAHPHHPLQGEILDFSALPEVRAALSGANGVQVLFNPVEREQRVVAYARVLKYGWGVLAVQPAAVAFAPRAASLRFLAAVYALLILLTSALAHVIIRTLRSLKERGQEIERLNEDLRQHAAQMEVTNKELEAFSYSVSHDLRAPLRSIDGFSQALQEDYAGKLDEQGQDFLKRVRESSQYMAQLIDDLLNLSRVTRREMRVQSVDLSSLAQIIAAELQRSQPERLVEFIIAPGLTAQGDERLLRLTLENLLGNAWKFTAKRSKAIIEFGADQSNGKKAYFVRDDGAGFDMAFADKLFGAFQRLHRSSEFPGTGVGLATVQRVIHRHGGTVWAQGAVGKGATFYFTLPA